MKHIKLFENFVQMGENPALIVAKGDWTGITQTGEGVDFTAPAVVNVTYYTNPTPEQISQAKDANLEPYSPEDAAYEIMSGDQGGSNLYKDNQEGLAILVDRSKGPEEIERIIQGIIDITNQGGDTGADMVIDVLSDPDAKNLYAPEYLAHLRACLELDIIGQEYIKKYPLPAGNSIGPKRLMERKLIFEVV